MAVYPPQTSEKIQETLLITLELAIGLNCIGMMNIQFVIKDETVYASRLTLMPAVQYHSV